MPFIAPAPLFDTLVESNTQVYTIQMALGSSHLRLRVGSKVQEQLGNVHRGAGVVKRGTTGVISSCYSRPGSEQEAAGLKLTRNRDRAGYGRVG